MIYIYTLDTNIIDIYIYSISSLQCIYTYIYYIIIYIYISTTVNIYCILLRTA